AKNNPAGGGVGVAEGGGAALPPPRPRPPPPPGEHGRPGRVSAVVERWSEPRGLSGFTTR
ncbi:acylphosphatase, partial [Kineococcus esterisolvens]|uniref:acylphosphatase n=1 Tax=Kineococcus sp. SYSU DK011 TaxID=3383132 RepID=UPI003D7D76B6